MDDAVTFGALVLGVGIAGMVAVQSHRLAERTRVPTAAFFLVAAALVGTVVEAPGHRTVERAVSLALVVILFDGGLSIGAGRFRTAGATISRSGWSARS